MSQVTWRAPDELVSRVKAVAAGRGQSLNDYLTRLATAAVDPDTADDEMQGLRERLARAGLLATPEPVRSRPGALELAEARRELGRGGVRVSEMVSDDRG